MLHTLPKSNIVRGYQRFGKIINGGICISEPHFSCYVLMVGSAGGKHKDSVAVGFSVPKKIIPLAVHRNRIKRLMKEAVRKNIHEWKQSQPDGRMEIVLMYKGRPLKDDPGVSLSVFETEWKKIQQRIGDLP